MELDIQFVQCFQQRLSVVNEMRRHSNDQQLDFTSASNETT